MNTGRKKTKAQAAIEFAVIFSVVLILFLALFVFLTDQLVGVNKSTERSQSLLRAQLLHEELVKVWSAPIGYTINLDIFATDTVSQTNMTLVNDTYGYLSEIIVKDRSGVEQIFFVTRRMKVAVPELCEGSHELTNTIDGVWLCCGSCDQHIPSRQPETIQCAQRIAGDVVQGIFHACNDDIFQTRADISQIRVFCPVSGKLELEFYHNNNFVGQTNTTTRLLESQYFIEQNFTVISGTTYWQSQIGVNNLTARCMQKTGIDTYKQYSISSLQWDVLP